MATTHSDGVPVQSTTVGNTPNGISAIVNSLPAEYYSHWLSNVAKARGMSPSMFRLYASDNLQLSSFTYVVRGLFPLESRPGMISLLAGKPNSSTFPLTSLSFTARNPLLPDGEESTLKLDPVALADGLQYGATAGYPPFVEWLTGLQEHEHGRKRDEGWRVTVGVGSQDLINKV